MKLETLRWMTKTERTPKDKGTTLTIQVTAYDNGLMNVNGIPMPGDWRDGDGVADSMNVVIAILNEFRRQVQRGTGPSVTSTTDAPELATAN